MRVAIVGFGVQGQKRKTVAGKDVVAIVDPVREGVTHKTLEDVPVASFDAALLCTPDEVKIGLISYLVAHGKHVLVEKPLIADADKALIDLATRVKARGVTCYTAYNHRFEPNIVRMRDLLASGRLGEIYSVRLFYGNGTARLVRDSAWRDAGSGVLRDLGSHLLDLIRFWFGNIEPIFDVVAAKRFENRAYDHVVLAGRGRPYLQLEMSLVSWRNHFTCDVVAEKGSAHIDSLCKWGPSIFSLRTRVLPAGRPAEAQTTEAMPDPTWALEYAHFKELCRTGAGNIANDIWIDRTITTAVRDAVALDRVGAGNG
jgi:scyllo-inositol 2-dehydrogenase (NADP+)